MTSYALGKAFLDRVAKEPLYIQRNARLLCLRGNHATNVAVLDGDEVLGYITDYSENESGAVAANLNGHVLPEICTTLDEALNVILG
ncbi:hypothetical protein [Sinomonas gamaensis]|uniref:hypothetical protein n=1 Tax=Sinomonas gamaensis TaxID=2565624 RepID=UPI001109475A|nr:hypothetical protein [Sinomonas gamaensis]